MIQTTPLSQRDPRWKDIKLGFRNPYTGKYVTIGTHGCTLTCLTMLLNAQGYKETPATVNEKLKEVKAFVGPLLYWSRVSLAFPRLKFTWRGYNYNNLRVAYYVYGKKIPVMVEVNDAPIGAPRHWVLYIGDRMLLDPWTGTGKRTSVYQPTGYALYDR